MSEERKILEMVSEGKISSEEAARLLSALKKDTKPVKKGHRLIINITRDNSPRPKLNLAIPISIIKIGAKFIPKNAEFNTSMESSNFDMSQIDWQEVINLATSGEIGELFYLDVEEDDGSITSIRIYVE